MNGFKISHQIKEIMTTVKQNRNTLRILRTSFENAEKMTAQATKLENVHLFLQRLQIIGVIIEFQVFHKFDYKYFDKIFN